VTINPLRLVADENIPPAAVRFLRELGHDVTDVKELGLIGVEDRRILELGFRESRFVLSLDSDFGRLAIAEERPNAGIVYLRPERPDAGSVIRLLERFLASIDTLAAGAIVVIEEGRARIRLPSAKS